MRKTAEQLHYEYITNLIGEKDFQQPTISRLAKTQQVKLPIVCNKCVSDDKIDLICDQSDKPKEFLSENVENKKELKPKDSKYMCFLTPCGESEYAKKLCILYSKNRSFTPDGNAGRANPMESVRKKNIQSAPLTKTETPKATEAKKSVTIAPQSSNKIHAIEKKPKEVYDPKAKNKGKDAKKKENGDKKEAEAPMAEGDIRYGYSRNGNLEIKRLPTRNWLIMDIFTEDVCNDQSEKSYSEWITRQKEDEDRAKQKFPSRIYEKQLKDFLSSYKKGPLTYEAWARQSYEVLLLKQKIRRAKKLEEIARQEKVKKQKENETQNSFHLWTLNKKLQKRKFEQKIAQAQQQFS